MTSEYSSYFSFFCPVCLHHSTNNNTAMPSAQTRPCFPCIILMPSSSLVTIQDYSSSFSGFSSFLEDCFFSSASWRAYIWEVLSPTPSRIFSSLVFSGTITFYLISSLSSRLFMFNSGASSSPLVASSITSFTTSLTGSGLGATGVGVGVMLTEEAFF